MCLNIIYAYGDLPEQYLGYSNASDSRCVLVQCMRQRMALCCHGLTPSTAHTQTVVEYTRQHTR